MIIPRENQPVYDLVTYAVGGDARKVIFDGFPRERVIASDLHAGDNQSE